MGDRKRIQNVMIKPTHDCNMGCDYCFVNKLTEKYRKQRMSLDTLNEIFRVLSNSAVESDIIWHGGEPTMVGVQWYKDMLELSYMYSDKSDFRHSMQSNGLLLNDEWADLAKNYGINIAVSYDGLYQDFRKKGTKDIVEKNLLNFKEKVGNVGCLSVVTEHSYKGIIENYKYFKSIGVPVNFNYGINPNYDEYGKYRGIPVEDYLREYVKYFKYWLNDRYGFFERSVDTFVKLVFGFGGGSCSTSDCRGNWLNVNPDGTTSHCNRYFPEEFGMGNIKDVDTVDELYQKDGYKAFSRLVQTRLDNNCIGCDYFIYCNGGCNSMHLMNSGSIANIDKSYCERFKMQFVQVYKVMKNIDIYKNNNLNLNFLDVLNEGAFTYKEIAEFMYMKGVDVSKLYFDEDNLTHSQEFKLFRVFNPIRFNVKGHEDYMTFEGVDRAVLETITTDLRFKEKRFKDMEQIYEDNKEEIYKILKFSEVVR